MPRGGARVGAGRKKVKATVTTLQTRNHRAPAKPADDSASTDKLQSAPDAPANLSEVGKIEWARIAPLLVEAGTLTPRDLGTLEGYCMAYANVRLAQQEVDDWGVIIDGKKNPACAVVQEQMGRMLAFGNELGLSPVSRRRLAGGEGGGKKNPFADL